MTTKIDQPMTETSLPRQCLDEGVRRGLEEEQERIRREITTLAKNLRVLEAYKTRIDALLSLDPEGDLFSPRNRPIGKISRHSADAVVALLERHGHPMHYGQICEEITASGQIDVTSKNPANTLRTRFASDERLERVGRGVFWLKGRPIIGDGRPLHCDACGEPRDAHRQSSTASPSHLH